MADLSLKSSQFRQEREQAWRELEDLLARVEKKGFKSLWAEDLHRLPVLYRSAASSLVMARSVSLDMNLLDYLTGLVRRAYLCVYGPKRRVGEAVSRFFLIDFPWVVRRYLAFVAVSLVLVVLGILAGYQLTIADPERYDTFVDDGVADGQSPSSTTPALREALYGRGDGELPVFASLLFVHNSKAGMLCFALGFVAGVPVIFVLFSTGLMLGAMAALYTSRGLGAELWAWVLPHGVTEIGALCLCGAAGLVLGNSLVFPGRHTRLRNLALHGREVALLAVGALAMFLVAGLIEGLFRQLVQDVSVRWLLAALTLAFWSWYFAVVGRDHGRDLAR